MRKIFVTIAAAALCLGLAAPAMAKGPGEEITQTQATIKGRGLTTPIHLSSRSDCGVAFPCFSLAELDDPLVNLATLTGVVFGPPRYAQPTNTAGVALDALGPSYEITYSVTFRDGVTRSVVQNVYPWAGAHGWIYTPKGQAIADREVSPGWMPAPTTLRAALVDLGIPSTPPPVAAPVSDAPSASPVPVIGLTSLVLAMLLAGGVLVARTRRTPRPAVLS
jgi:hypothetical protein